MSDLERFVVRASATRPETFDWGVLRWLMNGESMPDAQQTLGICRIEVGKRNPVHYHPNCEELLTMLAGVGRHRMDDDFIELHPGDTLRIPANVRHNLENIGPDPLQCVIAFSSSDRQTIFLE
jgi:quercetin dioxygenase-like cupin family protein